MGFEFTTTSTHDPLTIINKLEEALNKEGFGLLWTLNVKDKLNAKGLTFNDDYYILEICNPSDAQDVLSYTKFSGYFLPCKIVIFKEDDQTFVGLPKPTSLLGFIENSELKTKAEEIENRIIHCIQDAV